MATHAHSTPTLRSSFSVANTAARNGQDASASLAARRAELEAAIARGIAALDALDAAAADMEPEPAECSGDFEASAQAVTLAPDWHTARVVRFPARPAVRS